MQQINCEIVHVDETIRRVILTGGSPHDAETLQVVGEYEQTLKRSRELPVCGTCDQLVQEMPQLLAVFRAEGSLGFAASGICWQCQTRPAAELRRAAAAV